MFDNQRCITCGVQSTLPPAIVSFLWSLIDDLRQSKHNIDYLQVFNLYEATDAAEKPIQVVWHSQEEPQYDAFYTLCLPESEPIQAKIFVIDDTSHSTMLLAEEY